MPSAGAVIGHFDTVVQEAGVERGRARDWVVFRAVDYWLWGLNAGLTSCAAASTQRCSRSIAELSPADLVIPPGFVRTLGG
jgi:hypothetical protein